MTGSAAELGVLSAYPTADGSFSLHSDHFGEAFHNSAGALNEAQAKFVEPAELERFSSGQPLRILDVCVGLGYNSAAIFNALPAAPPASLTIQPNVRNEIKFTLNMICSSK